MTDNISNPCIPPISGSTGPHLSKPIFGWPGWWNACIPQAVMGTQDDFCTFYLG